MIADMGCTEGGVNLDHIFKRFTVVFAWAGIVGLVLMTLLFVVGARFNTTKSIPVGLYWASSQPVEKGVYVMFCPPQDHVFEEAKRRGYIGPGSCPGGYGYMMKRILAAKNDVVTVSSDGVTVNDKLLPLSLPVNFDKEGRALPYYRINHKTLTDDEVLMMSDVSGTSFDSRYFGPVLRSQIKTVIIPVVTW
jgi:conjugative transfer signal peptidase TraF